jgi:hypothetical protein
MEYNKEEICEKIKSIYPDIGECGIDIKVEYDESQNSLVVYLKKGNKEVKHFLPNEDADACLLGKQCVALGVEIAQLTDERYY